LVCWQGANLTTALWLQFTSPAGRVVRLLRGSLQIRHYKTRIASLVGVLDLDQQPAFLVLSLGRTLHCSKKSLLFLPARKNLLRLRDEIPGQRQ